MVEEIEISKTSLDKLRHLLKRDRHFDEGAAAVFLKKSGRNELAVMEAATFQALHALVIGLIKSGIATDEYVLDAVNEWCDEEEANLIVKRFAYFRRKMGVFIHGEEGDDQTATK